MLETRQGFFEAVGGVDGAAAVQRSRLVLGESWDIMHRMAIKLVPGGHPYHAIAEAAANAAREGNVTAAEVASITIIAAWHDAAGWPAAPTDSDRHGAQPGLFRRGRRGGPDVLLAACRNGRRSRIRRSIALIDRVRLEPTPRILASGKVQLLTFARAMAAH